MTNLKPVLKWAGGKTQLLPILKDNLPSFYKAYYEPFIGGASLLFSVQPSVAVINDINSQLIHLYKTIRDDASSLISIIQQYDSVLCTKEYYLKLRDAYNSKIENNILDVECSALMVWLNKHCFNGLYRVNSKGLFNVPYNNRVKGESVSESNLRAIHTYLNQSDIQILNMDFEQVCDQVQTNDFIYFDSPYFPETSTANFTDYTKDGFSMKDHLRLCDLFKRLNSIGAKVMLSNNDVPIVHELYSEFKIQTLNVKRMINRDSSKRKGQEVLITNY